MIDMLEAPEALKRVQAEVYRLTRQKVGALLSARAKVVTNPDRPAYGSRVWKDSKRLSIFGARQNPAHLGALMQNLPTNTRHPGVGRNIQIEKGKWRFIRTFSDRSDSLSGLPVVYADTSIPVEASDSFFYGSHKKRVFAQSKTFPHITQAVVADWAVPDSITPAEWDAIVEASIEEALEGGTV